MRRQRFGLVVLSASLVSVVVVRCAGSTAPNGTQNLSANGSWSQVRKASDVSADKNGFCRVTDAVKYQATSQSNLTLWVRGGGWEDATVLNSFASRVTGYVAIVLSASAPNNVDSMFEYYRSRMPGVTFKKIYTRGQDANDNKNAQVIRDAGGIVIPGGETDRLRHLYNSTNRWQRFN